MVGMIDSYWYELPPGPFVTVVADPPWRYNDKLGDGPRGAEAHYPTMPVGEIMCVPVANIMADNAHLYLWCTNAFLIEAHYVMAAWGFQKQTVLTWVKGRIIDGVLHQQIGMGHHFRNTTEHVLFGVRGKLPTLRKDMPTAFIAPKTRHSVKPDRLYEIVEQMSPGPYLELFAGGERFGWTCVGRYGGYACP